MRGVVVDLDALLAEADAVFEAVEPEFVPVVLAGRQLGVRFVPLDGAGWRELVLQHPPRSKVLQDLNLGYNVDDVVAAFPHVALVDGDQVDDMLRVVDGVTVSKWPAVWSRLTATGRKDVAAAMWAAHERTPERLVESLGKASPGGRKKRRS